MCVCACVKDVSYSLVLLPICEVNVDLTELHPFSLPSSPKAPNTSPEAQRNPKGMAWQTWKSLNLILIGNQWKSTIGRSWKWYSCMEDMEVVRPACFRTLSFTRHCRPWNLKRTCKTIRTNRKTESNPQWFGKNQINQQASEYDWIRCPSVGFNECTPWKQVFGRFLRVTWHRWTRMMRQAASMWLPACLFNVE